jgi:hypothetical protein
MPGAKINDKSRAIATGDFETDPFEHGATILPFCVGIYVGPNDNGDPEYWCGWGDDCAPRAVAYLRSLRGEYTIYFHNGGNFDFYFLLEWIEQDLMLINGRIVKCWIGKQQLRDSYAIFPDPLSAYKKDELTDDDYKTKFCRANRESYRDFILSYLQRDCVYLHEAVTFFHDTFGDFLTIGSCAMRQLRKFHEFESGNKRFHELFSPFYFGGRNQCFKSGVIHGDFKIYDINSQYPSVMRNFDHPIGTTSSVGDRIGPNTFFAEIEAVNHGALPTRTKTGLDFTVESGRFFATIHEINAGEDTGTLQVKKVISAYNFVKTGRFADFIDHYYELRLKAKHEGNKLGNLFFKRIMNACYGKFAQDPDSYEEYVITHGDFLEPPFRMVKSHNDYIVWGKPSLRKTYFNIATGASITGAARSILLRGLAKADTPLYCDTDSIICRDFTGDIDTDRLGAWKHEGNLSSIAIAGKKLYAAFDGEECIKKAHKGALLSGEDIRAIAEGREFRYESKAPKFRLGGNVKEPLYVERTIRKTAKLG